MLSTLDDPFCHDPFFYFEFMSSDTLKRRLITHKEELNPANILIKRLVMHDVVVFI